MRRTKNRNRIIGIVFVISMVMVLRMVIFPSNTSHVGAECEDLALPNASENPQAAAVAYLENRKPDEFSYRFETFIEKGARTFMEVTMSNDEVCFKAKLLVENWDKLEGMRKVNGQSYPKELHNLKWHLEPRHDGMHIMYDDMRTIID